MKLRYIIPATVLASFFVAGAASAQTGVSVTTTPVSGNISSGTGVTLGTVSITGPVGSAVTSIPFTVTAGGGASNASLSNCQLFNSSGASVTTGGNVVGSIGAGANTFSLNNATGLSGTPTVFSLRCDVASGIPAGSTFAINAATPNVTSPAPFAVNLDTAPSVPAGSQDVTLANIWLGTNATNSARVSSIPLTITAGNGAVAANLSGCAIRDSSNLSGSLTGSINPAGGTSVFSLAAPLTIGAGASEMLGLVCDVSASTPVGGTFTISISPSSITAVDAVTGASVTPTAVIGVGPNGLPASTSGTLIVSGSTSTGGTGGTGTGTGTGTPGVPNTGAPVAGTVLALTLAALAALMGVTALRSYAR